MPLATDSEIAKFLAERADFAEIRAVENQTGGIDIMLRLDGTYFDPDVMDDPGLVEYFRKRLLAALRADGVPERDIKASRLLRP
jgi:hypothetical protein